MYSIHAAVLTFDLSLGEGSLIHTALSGEEKKNICGTASQPELHDFGCFYAFSCRITDLNTLKQNSNRPRSVQCNKSNSYFNVVLHLLIVEEAKQKENLFTVS